MRTAINSLVEIPQVQSLMEDPGRALNRPPKQPHGVATKEYHDKEKSTLATHSGISTALQRPAILEDGKRNEPTVRPVETGGTSLETTTIPQRM